MSKSEVSVEIDGKTYTGTVTVSKGHLISVSTSFGTKSTLIGGSPPEAIAKMLLRELVKEEQKDDRASS